MTKRAEELAREAALVAMPLKETTARFQAALEQYGRECIEAASKLAEKDKRLQGLARVTVAASIRNAPLP